VRRKYLIALVVAMIAAAGVIAGVLVGASETRGWTRLATVESVKAHGGVVYSDARKLFVVADGGEVFVLSSISPHSPAAPERVRFCVSSRQFQAEQHGETFDLHGVYVLGPAPRGMDRYPVKVYRGIVYTKPKELVPGPARGTITSLPQRGQRCAELDSDDPGFFAGVS
jgi:nitrite reductase/ring-hydroxylating ferredoxin subunit